MSPTVMALLIPLATSLLAKWTKNNQFGPGRTPPPPHNLATGLGNLFSLFGGFRSVLDGLATDVSGDTDANFKKKIDKFTKDIENVDKYVKLFQEMAGGLQEDGVLGNSTLSSLLRNLLGGDDHLPDSGTPNVAGLMRYQYFVDSIPAVPTVDASISILAEAWASWRKVCGVRARQVPSEAMANVVVRQKFLDGSGPVLGQATLGPLGSSVLELEMDQGEPWDAVSFEGAICHEIGHLMGLDHNTTPGTLMNQVIARGLIKPTDGDAQKAREKFGPPDPILIIQPDFPVPI